MQEASPVLESAPSRANATPEALLSALTLPSLSHTPGDGDCFFHSLSSKHIHIPRDIAALSLHLYPSLEAYAIGAIDGVLRDAQGTIIGRCRPDKESPPVELKRSGPEGLETVVVRSLEELVEAMAVQKTWVETPLLASLAIVLGRSITLHSLPQSSDDFLDSTNELQAPCTYVFPHSPALSEDQVATRNSLRSGTFNQPDGHATLLLFCAEGHYVPDVRELNTGSAVLARQPQNKHLLTVDTSLPAYPLSTPLLFLPPTEDAQSSVYNHEPSSPAVKRVRLDDVGRFASPNSGSRSESANSNNKSQPLDAAMVDASSAGTADEDDWDEGEEELEEEEEDPEEQMQTLTAAAEEMGIDDVAEEAGAGEEDDEAVEQADATRANVDLDSIPDVQFFKSLSAMRFVSRIADQSPDPQATVDFFNSIRVQAAQPRRSWSRHQQDMLNAEIISIIKMVQIMESKGIPSGFPESYILSSGSFDALIQFFLFYAPAQADKPHPHVVYAPGHSHTMSFLDVIGIPPWIGMTDMVPRFVDIPKQGGAGQTKKTTTWPFDKLVPSKQDRDEIIAPRLDFLNLLWTSQLTGDLKFNVVFGLQVSHQHAKAIDTLKRDSRFEVRDFEVSLRVGAAKNQHGGFDKGTFTFRVIQVLKAGTEIIISTAVYAPHVCFPMIRRIWYSKLKFHSGYMLDAIFGLVLTLCGGDTYLDVGFKNLAVRALPCASGFAFSIGGEITNLRSQEIRNGKPTPFGDLPADMQEYARRMHPEIFGDATDSTIFVKDTVTVNRGQKRKRGKRGLVSTLRFLTIAMGEKGYQKRVELYGENGGIGFTLMKDWQAKAMETPAVDRYGNQTTLLKKTLRDRKGPTGAGARELINKIGGLVGALLDGPKFTEYYNGKNLSLVRIKKQLEEDGVVKKDEYTGLQIGNKFRKFNGDTKGFAADLAQGTKWNKANLKAKYERLAGGGKKKKGEK